MDFTDKNNRPDTALANEMGNIMSKLPKKRRTTPNFSAYSGLADSVKNYAGPKEGSKSSLGTVTVPYGGSTRYEKFHPGVDVGNKIGTPISAFAKGKVTDVQRGKVQGNKGYGNYVIITDELGNKHRYSHLSQDFVKLGDYINKGQVFSNMGNTGSAYSTSGGTGSHLDYRIKDMYDKWVNPSQFISK